MNPEDAPTVQNPPCLHCGEEHDQISQSFITEQDQHVELELTFNLAEVA